MLLPVLIITALLSWVPESNAHLVDFESTEPFEQRFRILSDNTEPDLMHLNLTTTQRRLSSEYWTKIIDHVTQEKLKEIIHQNKNYLSAEPFPHMAATNVFPQEVLDAINLEIPDDAKKTKPGCAAGALCFNSGVDEKSKNAWMSESQFSPATLATLKFMQSSLFVKFLEKLTGIEGIIPDGKYYGAGIHQTLSGGFLNIHADFNFNRQDKLHRRVNVFLYLNPDWKDEYGGHLELWSRDLKNCSARISVDQGKLVVFSTTDFSYHGHQSPLRCPADRSRRSLAMYYYTKTRPETECEENNCFSFHSTLFKTTQCPECSDAKCQVPKA